MQRSHGYWCVLRLMIQVLRLCVAETSGTQTNPVRPGREHRSAHAAEQRTYKNQSTAMISVMSSVGSPTDVNTITIVTSPAWGIPAAPMLAAVAVMLQGTGKHSSQQSAEKRWSHWQICQEVAQNHNLQNILAAFLPWSPSGMVTRGTGTQQPGSPCQTRTRKVKG